MSEHHKTLLSIHQASVQEVFDKYKANYNFLGLYFTAGDTPFITFKSTSGAFQQPLKIGKRAHSLGFVYDTSQDFATQTTSFLA